MAPLRRGGLHRRYAVFSNLVDTIQTVTQRAEERAWQRLGRDGQEAATIAEAVEEVCSSPPAKLGDINEVLAITTVCLAMWQADMLPTRLWQSHNLANTVSATGILGEVQEEKPSLTRKEFLGSNHMQSLSEDCKQTRMDRHTDFLFPIYLRRKRKWSTQMLQQQGIVALFPMNGAHTSLHHRAGVEQTGVH